MAVLRNGDEAFPAMLEAIRAADSTIEFLTFVYWSGDIAHRFADTLAERAQQGVHVRVLLDSFGARTMPPELVPQMEQAGVDVRWFRRLRTWKLWTIDKRTHRKILVVDSQIAITGGVGIAEEWVGNARDHSEWRDTHFRVTGGAVYGLQGAFFDNWPKTDREMAWVAESAAPPPEAGGMAVQVIRSVSSVEKNVISTINHLLLTLAQQRVRIATAYFSPDPALAEALVEAAGRGVGVDIMIPGKHVDKRVSRLAGAREMEDLLHGGIRLWRYERSMLHAKMFTIDGALACIGSANFNMRSMRKDEEVVLLVANEGLTAKLEAHFDEDLQLCERVTRRDWHQRGMYRRLMETASRLVKAQT